MPGVKGKSGRRPGFKNPNAGRPASGLNALTAKIEQAFAELARSVSAPHVQRIEVIEIERCPACGVVGWGEFAVAAEQFDGYEIVELLRLTIVDQPTRHAKSCPAKHL